MDTLFVPYKARKACPRGEAADGSALPFSDCFGWEKWGSRNKIHRIRIPLLSFDPSNQRDNYTTDTANTRVTKVTNHSGWGQRRVYDFGTVLHVFPQGSVSL